MENGIDYLNSLGLHKVKPGLDRINKLLHSLGDPQEKVPGIIIAGTNGKGSVASTIASILSAQGYNVGLYTSPHLISITERIKINGAQITEPNLSSILLELKEVCEKSQIEPSYFEIVTACAFVYFARRNVDFNVLEVGMGGRWDATNVITPLVSVITNISKDHTEYLGETIEQIAAEKACIIKPRVPVITGATTEALEVIKQRAKEEASPLLLYGRDFLIKGNNPDDFDYEGINFYLKNLRSNLKSSYQLKNIAFAIAAIESLETNHNITTSKQCIRDGISNIHWEGRFEIIREEPPLILDGAHNPGAAKSLVESISEKYPDTLFTFLIAMLDDKGHLEFLKEICSIADKLIITKVPSERTAETQQLLTLAKEHIDNVEVIEDYRSAYSTVLNSNKPSCITGSLYLIGAIKNLRQNP